MAAGRIPRDLADAAAVHAARREVMAALALLAVTPLDEQVADQMRGALDRVQSEEVRTAIRRMGIRSVPRPPLRVVGSHPPNNNFVGHPGRRLMAVGGAA